MSDSLTALLPSVPFVESPFFGEIFAPDRFDPSTVRVARDLNENGFAVLDFPDDINELGARIQKALFSQFDWEAYRQGKVDGLRVQDAWQTNADVKRIAVNAKILSLLATLYGRKPIPFQTLNFPVGTQQHFHSDSIHFSSRPERFMCGVWVALEDVDEANGPLEYYPGSHRLPIYTNEHIGRNPPAANVAGNYGVYEQLWRELARVHRLERAEFRPKKGQALIWAANLLHGGSKQPDRNRTRWSQVTHYFFEDCCYYTPLVERPLKSVELRRIVNIQTGAIVPNMLNGEVIPESSLQTRLASLWGKVRRRL